MNSKYKYIIISFIFTLTISYGITINLEPNEDITSIVQRYSKQGEKNIVLNLNSYYTGIVIYDNSLKSLTINGNNASVNYIDIAIGGDVNIYNLKIHTPDSLWAINIMAKNYKLSNIQIKALRSMVCYGSSGGELDRIKVIGKPFLGIDYTKRNGYCEILDVYPGSEAFAQGISKGDRIISINGHPTKNMSLSAISNYLSKNSFYINVGNFGKYRTIHIKKRKLSYAYIIGKKYIHIYSSNLPFTILPLFAVDSLKISNTKIKYSVLSSSPIRENFLIGIITHPPNRFHRWRVEMWDSHLKKYDLNDLNKIFKNLDVICSYDVQQTYFEAQYFYEQLKNNYISDDSVPTTILLARKQLKKKNYNKAKILYKQYINNSVLLDKRDYALRFEAYTRVYVEKYRDKILGYLHDILLGKPAPNWLNNTESFSSLIFNPGYRKDDINFFNDEVNLYKTFYNERKNELFGNVKNFESEIDDTTGAFILGLEHTLKQYTSRVDIIYRYIHFDLPLTDAMASFYLKIGLYTDFSVGFFQGAWRGIKTIFIFPVVRDIYKQNKEVEAKNNVISNIGIYEQLTELKLAFSTTNEIKLKPNSKTDNIWMYINKWIAKLIKDDKLMEEIQDRARTSADRLKPPPLENMGNY